MVKQIQTLYDYLYQMLISQFLNGTFQPGQPFPSQRVLCQRYNAGITTVRKVMKMLDEEGYVRTVKGQPSIVTYQASPETYAGFLVQGRDEIADAYKGLELLMPIFLPRRRPAVQGARIKAFTWIDRPHIRPYGA